MTLRGSQMVGFLWALQLDAAFEQWRFAPPFIHQAGLFIALFIVLFTALFIVL